jgi:hypothetical protein
LLARLGKSIRKNKKKRKSPSTDPPSPMAPLPGPRVRRRRRSPHPTDLHRIRHGAADTRSRPTEAAAAGSGPPEATAHQMRSPYTRSSMEGEGSCQCRIWGPPKPPTPDMGLHKLGGRAGRGGVARPEGGMATLRRRQEGPPRHGCPVLKGPNMARGG